VTYSSSEHTDSLNGQLSARTSLGSRISLLCVSIALTMIELLPVLLFVSRVFIGFGLEVLQPIDLVARQIDYLVAADYPVLLAGDRLSEGGFNPPGLFQTGLEPRVLAFKFGFVHFRAFRVFSHASTALREAFPIG